MTIKVGITENKNTIENTTLNIVYRDSNEKKHVTVCPRRRTSQGFGTLPPTMVLIAAKRKEKGSIH